MLYSDAEMYPRMRATIFAGPGRRQGWPGFFLHIWWVLAVLLNGPEEAAAKSLRIVSYNVRNYNLNDRIVDGVYRTGYPKPEQEKAAVRRILRELAADVVLLQEMGPAPFLEELREDLRQEGLDYPCIVVQEGEDPARNLALLAREPPAAVRRVHHLQFSYLGAKTPVKRGLMEITVRHDGREMLLFHLHLKSRWEDHREDPESRQRRLGEAVAIRDYIRERTASGESGTSLPFLIVGDFNDTRDSPVLARFLQVGGQVISRMVPTVDNRGESWTYYDPRSDTYSRVDFFLAAPSLWPWLQQPAMVADGAYLLEGSDHRPISIVITGSVTDPPENYHR